MKDVKSTCKIALVQAEPVMFDKAAGLEKALLYIDEAAAQKPDLIVFPELFIPGYPIGMNFGFSMGKRNADGPQGTGSAIMTHPSSQVRRSFSSSPRRRKERARTSASAFPSATP